MSKFDKIFEAREQDAVAEPDKSSGEGKTKSRETSQKAEKSIGVSVPTKRGRPTAKRSNPDFVGFTTYIRRDTHTKVKIGLLRENKGRELSELVEELLGHWATKNNF